MLYKKIKIWGFIPWFKKLSIDEAKKHIQTLEVLQAYVSKNNLASLKITRKITAGKPARFIIKASDRLRCVHDYEHHCINEGHYDEERWYKCKKCGQEMDIKNA